MSAVERNQMWVLNHAWDIGARKVGLVANCFTVGEVVAALGFSRNTVQKYVDLMVEQGIVRRVVLTKKLSIYKFSRGYIEYRASLNIVPLA